MNIVNTVAARLKTPLGVSGAGVLAIHPSSAARGVRASLTGAIVSRDRINGKIQERPLKAVKRMEDEVDWKRTAEKLQQEIEIWRSKEESSRKELAEAKRREADLAKERALMKTLLDTRRQELHDAQRFLGTAEPISESNIVQDIRRINAEIFNLARSAADQIQRDPKRQTRRDAKAQVTSVLGENFTRHLQTMSSQDDTILLEIAMQAAVTRYISQMISNWYSNGDGNAAFSIVHELIRQSEENQSVAGQWRALTRRYAQPTPLDAQQFENDHIRRLSVLLSQILQVAGMRESIGQDAQEILQIIVRAALDIRRVTGEVMVSSDYEIPPIAVEDIFNSQEMHDAYREKGIKRATGLRVWCCTTLGLRRVEKLPHGLHQVVLIKPEVALETLMLDLGIMHDGAGIRSA
ncbi:hypothetical protein POSPLADRAFT_1037140 [Postia placenta MAD-698-R-SB12]|uniref:Uncharacterized protein n=1 Tax=Postia placenta MAD-698-R-SB12 TaxID=670580 RepID=A0A1X6MKR6_9APHY|nr:hypothetical protein POSPLADRAFT_1037140 [Postia placenta MAD-698-R-SB12]OSX56879.1 hypothetical protein POSPLADRAFT_1037140 [Postia placenta MAD-698-R-SB12]